MGEFLSWLKVHSPELWAAAGGLLIIGFLAHALSRPQSRVEVKNQNRSVGVGRDNRGIINTGDISQTTQAGSHWLSTFASWASILGLAIGVISLIPVIQGWLDGPAK